MVKHILLSLLTIFPLLATSHSFASAASSRSSRRERERAALKACLSGQYVQGVEILSDLYIDTRAPTYLFNQGRCFEQNRRFEEAIGRFEEYLRAAENSKRPFSDKDKTEAEKHIFSCKEKLAEQRQAEAVALEPPPSEDTVVTPPPPPPPTINDPPPGDAPAITTKPRVRHASTAGSGLRATGAVLAVAGGVGVLVGVAFNVKANSLASDIENNVGGYTSDSSSQQRNYQSLSRIGYGVGAACLAMGAVLYIGGTRRAETAKKASLALAPMTTGTNTGLILAGAF